MPEDFRLTSSAFSNGGHIPRKHTSDGAGNQKDMSPPLSWHGVPEGTETLALIMEDPDAPDPAAPVAPFTHWVVASIPATLKGLPAGFSSKDIGEDTEFGGLQEGVNDMKTPHYTGPAGPTGEHRYVFTLYALGTKLKLGNKVTKEKLLDAMEGHILGEAVLTGVHSKEKGSANDGSGASVMPPQVKEQGVGGRH